jgi:hypothetical protein
MRNAASCIRRAFAEMGGRTWEARFAAGGGGIGSLLALARSVRRAPTIRTVLPTSLGAAQRGAA